MKKRKLGGSGLEVSPLCFGGNVFGWTIDESQSFQLLDAFAGAGFNFIDTADVYSRWAPGNKGGESETIIGKWLKRSKNRKDMIIATKVGMEMGPRQKGLSKSYIFKAVEDSLERLQTDYIDLYQSHLDDRETPLEETLEAYYHLKQQGKIRAVGASNYNAERLSLALEIGSKKGFPLYQSLQPHYNLYDRAEFEENLAPLCLKKGLGVISYFSLASGFLTGKYRTEKDFSKSARGQGMQKYFNERGMRILQSLDQVAERYQATPAQIALAWLWTRPGLTAPIASATTLEQLEELMGATKLSLDESSLEILNKASHESADQTSRGDLR